MEKNNNSANQKIFFLALDVKPLNTSVNKNNAVVKLQCWIKAFNQTLAKNQAENDLKIEGWKISKETELFETTKDDYFPPCNGLDSFKKAEEKGAYYLFPEDSICNIN